MQCNYHSCQKEARHSLQGKRYCAWHYREESLLLDDEYDDDEDELDDDDLDDEYES